MRRTIKFLAKQIVCVRGLEPPMGLAVIIGETSPDIWGVTIEQDGKPTEREYTGGELRPLTVKERGKQ